MRTPVVGHYAILADRLRRGVRGEVSGLLAGLGAIVLEDEQVFPTNRAAVSAFETPDR